MDLISPHIDVQVVPIKMDNVLIVAINVEPSVNLVSVSQEKNGPYYCFPYRTDFGNRFMAFDEVESVYLMAGVYDFVLIVRGQTMQDIAMFVARKLSTIDGVLSTGTHFIMRRYKDRGMNLTDFDGDKDERSLIL